MKQESVTDSKKYLKKDLRLIIGLAVIVTAVFVGITIFDNNTGQMSSYAANFYSLLVQ